FRAGRSRSRRASGTRYGRPAQCGRDGTARSRSLRSVRVGSSLPPRGCVDEEVVLPGPRPFLPIDGVRLPPEARDGAIDGDEAANLANQLVVRELADAPSLPNPQLVTVRPLQAVEPQSEGKTRWRSRRARARPTLSLSHAVPAGDRSHSQSSSESSPRRRAAACSSRVSGGG